MLTKDSQQIRKSDDTIINPATDENLVTRLSESDFDTKIGSLTEPAPAIDTASSGLNGRLQRIAQRITSLIALLPSALVGGRFDTNLGSWLGSTVPTVGQKTMANSVPVVLPSNQTISVSLPNSITPLGLYYAHSGRFTIQASAHGATAGFMWIVNTSSTITGRIRRIWVTTSPTSLAIYASAPRITIERITFTGTPSGATITPAKRNSNDSTNTLTIRTASTGMTITTGATLRAHTVSFTFDGKIGNNFQQMIEFATDNDAIVLSQNQGLVFRQSDAGTVADTRLLIIDIEWEEF